MVLLKTTNKKSINVVAGLFDMVVGQKAVLRENVLVIADNLTTLIALPTVTATKIQSR